MWRMNSLEERFGHSFYFFFCSLLGSSSSRVSLVELCWSRNRTNELFSNILFTYMTQRERVCESKCVLILNIVRKNLPALLFDHHHHLDLCHLWNQADLVAHAHPRKHVQWWVSIVHRMNQSFSMNRDWRSYKYTLQKMFRLSHTLYIFSSSTIPILHSISLGCLLETSNFYVPKLPSHCWREVFEASLFSL